jgi:hypothetical protein
VLLLAEQLRPHGRRAQRRHVHVVPPHLGVHGLREREQVGLGRRVTRRVRQRHHPRGRRDVEDRARAPFDHAGKEAAQQVEWRLAQQPHLVELLLEVRLVQRAAGGEAGVVDEHVRAQRQVADELGPLGRVGEVA